MDPNATLEMIDDALAEGDRAMAREHRSNLFTWLSRGGFAPEWEAYPDAAKFCGPMVARYSGEASK